MLIRKEVKIISDPPQDASALFLDMNSYFARVEQQVQPIYRGKPVGITPYTGDTGCIIACSYEAKALGVATGFTVGEAKRQCPKIIILPARPALYHLYHKEIAKVLESFSPFVRPLSIDEFVIRLTGRDRASDPAKTMAFAIKSAIRERVGDWLTCSIGIGPNQFLAKTAAELKKPDGLFEITLEDLQSIYQILQLTDLCGINRGLAAQCHSFGIYSVLDFYHQSLSEISSRFGVLGKVWYFRLRGYEVDDINSSTKSIGHSHVLAPEFRTQDGARKVLGKLIEKAGFRLRQSNFWATSIFLGIRFYDHVGWSKFIRTVPFQDNHTFRTLAYKLFDECDFILPPFVISISACCLMKNYARPYSLFTEIQRIDNLAKAMDALNDRFGAATIYPASLYGAEHSAPDRIPFGRPRFEILNE